MKNEIAKELLKNVEEFYQKYNKLDEETTTLIISENKWSLKQIVGHLIDSTSNNHQRFIRFQIDKSLNFPDYNRDEWLNIVDYNKICFFELVSLFKYFNILISKIIENIDEKSLGKKWEINWSDSRKSITFSGLIEHYLAHIKEHFKHFEDRLTEIKNGNCI